ncbi:MAG: DUF5698 domain-containing protein [bacterium]|nr:DUF5698 domain-containing protein [bacterium]
MTDLVLVGLIFIFRVANYAIGTLRLVAVTRNQRILASVMAVFEALVFAVVIANVVTDLNNFANLASYCAGAAVGNYVGMALEARFVTGYATVNLITTQNGHEIALALRESGYGVTEIVGEGRSGTVVTLRAVVNKRAIADVVRQARAINPEVFITVEDARTVERGWMSVGRGGTRS